MPPVPFKNALKRDIHFTRHGHEFGAATPEEYELLADAFMLGPMNADTQERLRPNGRLRNRLDFVAVHFGVAEVRRPVINTFYIPRPDTIARHGGAAQLFADYCAMPD
jgi:hypothetical protein